MPGQGRRPMSPVRDDLAVRLFRAMYAEFDLRTIGGIHVVVPRGTPWFAGHSLGEIARQISEYEHPHTDQAQGESPTDSALLADCGHSGPVTS